MLIDSCEVSEVSETGVAEAEADSRTKPDRMYDFRRFTTCVLLMMNDSLVNKAQTLRDLFTEGKSIYLNEEQVNNYFS